MIRFEGASFAFGQKKVINNISFTLNEGEFLCILGRNGSGKSTLAKLFNGILIPDSGSIMVDGLLTSDKDSITKIRSKVGVVFQNPDNQMVTTPVEDEVAFGPENLCLPSSEIEERVAWALENVGLSEYRKKEPYELSGGERQLLAIAGVLAMRPKVLVLDEPTSMLDPLYRNRFIDILLDFRNRLSLSMVLITHHMEEAIMADRIMILDRGEIAKLDTPKEVFVDYELLRANSLSLPEITLLGRLLYERGIIKNAVSLSKEELLEALNDRVG